MPPIAIPRPSPPDQPYCPGLIQATQLDQYSVNSIYGPLCGAGSHQLSRIPVNRILSPDWLSLILANVTPAHLKLWPLQGDGLQTLLGWRPSEGVAAGHMSRFLSPATLLKVERATDRRRIFVVCRHCKSRPPCHTSDHHLDILLLPSQVPQPLLLVVSSQLGNQKL